MKTVVCACGTMGYRGILRLMESGFEITLVFTCEDSASIPIQDLCRNNVISFVTPRDPNQYGWMEKIRNAAPDMLFSFAYPAHLKAQLLAIPERGSYRIHQSLLPRYRGPEPVRRAIMAGESSTGVTLHELVVDPYAGGIVAQEQVDIAPDDTAMSLSDRIEQAADALLKAVLPRMRALDIPLKPQDLAAGSTHRELTPEDGGIPWDRSADEINNLIRAFSRPFPGAFSILGEEMVFFIRAEVVHDFSLEPGVLGFQGGTVSIGTGYGVLEPREIEVNGRVLTGSGLFFFFREHEKDVFQ